MLLQLCCSWGWPEKCCDVCCVWCLICALPFACSLAHTHSHTPSTIIGTQHNTQASERCNPSQITCVCPMVLPRFRRIKVWPIIFRSSYLCSDACQKIACLWDRKTAIPLQLKRAILRVRRVSLVSRGEWLRLRLIRLSADRMKVVFFAIQSRPLNIQRDSDLYEDNMQRRIQFYPNPFAFQY